MILSCGELKLISSVEREVVWVRVSDTPRE